MRNALMIGLISALASCATGSSARGLQADAAAEAPRQPTRSQLIAARLAGMHMAATLLHQRIKATVTNRSDVRQQVHDAEGLILWAAAIPGLFPPGSAGGDSRARPEIWANRADFDRKAADLGAAASRLAERAEAGDSAGFAAQAGAVEAACSACHSAYRSN